MRDEMNMCAACETGTLIIVGVNPTGEWWIVKCLRCGDITNPETLAELAEKENV
jgi:hypothetical protein